MRIGNIELPAGAGLAPKMCIRDRAKPAPSTPSIFMQTSATWARKSSNPSIRSDTSHCSSMGIGAASSRALLANRRARASGHRYRCLRFFCRRRLWFCRRFLLRLRRLRLDRLRTLLRGPSLRHSFYLRGSHLLRLCALRLRGLNLRRSFYLRGSRILRPVSYTHLDVYKRQGFSLYPFMPAGSHSLPESPSSSTESDSGICILFDIKSCLLYTSRCV